MSRLVSLAPVLAVVLVVAACGDVASPPPGSTGPSASTVAAVSATASASAGGPATEIPAPGASASAGVTPRPSPTPKPTPKPTPAPFRMTSAAFARGGAIPAVHTCDGADVSPAIAWTGVPKGTRALVLLVLDRDAHQFGHWIVLDMPATVKGLSRGAGGSSSTMQQGTNDFGRVGWGGPCPPSGTHHYRFEVAALSAPLDLVGHPTARAVIDALSKVDFISTTTLDGTYTR